MCLRVGLWFVGWFLGWFCFNLFVLLVVVGWIGFWVVWFCGYLGFLVWGLV